MICAAVSTARPGLRRNFLPVDLPVVGGRSSCSVRQQWMLLGCWRLQLAKSPPDLSVAGGPGTPRSPARRAAAERRWAFPPPRSASDQSRWRKWTSTSPDTGRTTPAAPAPGPASSNCRGCRSDATNRFGSIRALLFGLSFTFDNSPADSPPINGTFVAGLCLSHAATETQLSRSCQRFANGFRKVG
jgi:hypothetical protein